MASSSIRDRMKRAGPLWKAMQARMDALIEGHNQLVGIVLGGQNPHLVNDTTNVTSLAEGDTGDLEQAIDLAQDLITKYEAHIGSGTHHIAVDSTNVVTELGVPIEIYTLLDELKVDYEAHRVLTAGSVHSGADSTNTITADDATTKASAITLANDLRTQFIANYANVTTHHGADGSADAPAVAELAAGATWEDIAELADDLRASYEAHRVNTAGGIHGGADSTNTVTATAIGTFATAVYAGPNEMKTDFNAHIIESGTSHRFSDDSMTVSAANASSTATMVTLTNAMRSSYLDHISRGAELSAGPTVATLDED